MSLVLANLHKYLLMHKKEFVKPFFM